MNEDIGSLFHQGGERLTANVSGVVSWERREGKGREEYQ